MYVRPKLPVSIFHVIAQYLFVGHLPGALVSNAASTTWREDAALRAERSAGRRCRCRPAHLVQVPQRLRVRTDQAALRVRQAVLLAELAYHGLGPLQVGPGHAREQVVLDLVVKPAERQVGQPAALDVA